MVVLFTMCCIFIALAVLTGIAQFIEENKDD